MITRKGNYVEGTSRSQLILLPDTLDDYVDEDDPVRFIDAFVDSLDMKQLGFKRSEPNEEGRPPYDPGDMLKLYIYGYLNQIRTSRKLERECHRNVEAMWLMKKLAPDFKTIADFRKENIDCIKLVFKEFLYLCKSLDLFGAELVAIDGSKFKAVNSKDRNFNEEKLLDRLKLINERVERYISELEENDRSDGIVAAGQMKNLNEKVKQLQAKKREYELLLGKMNESGQKEISLTDPESRLMKNNGRIEVCYNTQLAVDSKNKLIAEYDLTNHHNDENQLSSMAKKAKDMLGVESLEVTADKGYHKFEEIKECVDNGITPYVPEPSRGEANAARRRGIPTIEFYEDKFIYDKKSNTYTCPAGKILSFCYWKKNQHNKRYALYRTEGACFTCPFYMTKCTQGEEGRIMKRWEHEDVLDEMRTRLRSLDGWKKAEMRFELAEHPFGTIKRTFNQGYLLLRGLRKVRDEVGFTMLTYNMRRAINILGTKTLLASLNT